MSAHRRREDLPYAEGVGVEGVALLRLQVQQSVRLGRFDDRHARLAANQVAGEDVPAQRIFDGNGGDVVVARLAHRLDEPRSTVRHWQQVEGVTRPRRADASRDRGRGFRGVEAALEFLGSDEDAHWRSMDPGERGLVRYFVGCRRSRPR